MKNYEIGQGTEDVNRPKELFFYLNLDELEEAIKENPRLITMNTFEEPEVDEENVIADQKLSRFVTIKAKRLQSNSDKFNLTLHPLDWKPKEI